MKTVSIGLIGYGTIGQGVVRLLYENSEMFNKRTNIKYDLKYIIDKDLDRPRDVQPPPGRLTSDLDALINDPEVSIGIELIGGTTTAREVVRRLLAAGKDVVTANKALLAHHGAELFKFARDHGRCICFEASCAGGIPIIQALRSGMVANRIDMLYGIVNGTCNYILSSMAEDGKSYQIALKEAQEAGFAEADPTLDVDGTDSAHKLAIMASMAFGASIPYDALHVEGIDQVCIEDICYGREMGYIMKLLAIGEATRQGVVVRVHPAFISERDPLARVSGPFNAVSVYGHSVGHQMYYGRGAGRMPTASAVVADVVDIALGNAQRTFEHLAVLPDQTPPAMILPDDQITGRFYARLMAADKPGVLAQFSDVFGKHDISISAVRQHEGQGNQLGDVDTVPVVVLTHPAVEGKMRAALDEIGNLECVAEPPVCIRIVDQPIEWR